MGCGAGNLLVCDLVSLQMESVAQVYTGKSLLLTHRCQLFIEQVKCTFYSSI